MALTEMSDFSWKWVNQPDEITGDPDALKTNIDSQAKEIRDYINGTLKTEVDDKQQLDADLTAVAALTDTGLIAKTGAGTAQTRTLTAPAAGITVINGDGVSGNPTLALDNDLAALEGLAANGMIARTGDGTAAVRTITGTENQVTVTNGDGVSGNPTLSLPQDIHDGASPTFAGMTLTGKEGVLKTSGGVVSGNATIDDIGEGTTYKKLTATKEGYIGQDVKTTASPTFSGGTINGNLAVTGTVDGRDISADINQAVKTTDSPTFAGLAVDTDTIKVDSTNHRVGIGVATPNYQLETDGDVRIQGEQLLRFGGTGASDTKFTMGYNTTNNSIRISYTGA